MNVAQQAFYSYRYLYSNYATRNVRVVVYDYADHDAQRAIGYLPPPRNCASDPLLVSGVLYMKNWHNVHRNM